MALFELEVSDDFIINEVFFIENIFNKLVKKNNLEYNDEDKLFFNDYFLFTEKYSFLHAKGNFIISNNYNLLNNIIVNPLEFNQNTTDEVCLYSTWFLFYLALNKSIDGRNIKDDFLSHLDNFKFMEEYLVKTLFIDNADLNDENIEKLECLRIELNKSLNLYIKNKYKDENELIDFLRFLLKLHKIYFNNEQYKIMWNLESIYIYSIINMLKNSYDLEYRDVISKVSFKMGSRMTRIDTIYIELPKHIEDNKIYFINKNIIEKINRVFDINLNENELFSIINKEKYFETFNSIIELQKRFFSTKKKDLTLCLSIFMGLVLGFESRIKECTNLNPKIDSLYTHFKEFGLDNEVLGTYQYVNLDTSIDIFEKILEQKNSIEKYLMLYRSMRNYLAHGNIDYNQLFNVLLKNDKYIKESIYSILIIIYFLRNKQE